MSIKNFSIDDVQLYKEQQEDLDFSIVEIWAMAEGDNSHRNPISKQVLEDNAETFRGKFIVAKFDKFTKDTTTHVPDEVIIGYIDPNSEIEFRSKEVEGIEKEFVVVKGLLSKIYASEVVAMFRANNQRTVSCEFSCSLTYQENESGEAIDEFGRVLNIENPILSYSIHGITILGVKFNPSIKGTEIKVKRFMENNNSKYNLKELAKQRIEQINVKEFSSENLLNINNEDNERNDFMEEKNLNLSESENKEEDIVMEEPKQEEQSEEKEMGCDNIQEEEKEMGCDNKEMSDDDEESKEEDKEEDKEENKEEEKKFSLDAYVDESAMLVMLENETETNKALVNSLLKEFSAEDIVKKYVELLNEKDLLMAEKIQNDNEKKEKKFSAIMASVKEDLEEKEFSELFEEGKELALEQLNAFENKVKAFAYEATKRNNVNKEESEIMRFGTSEEQINDNADVFTRLSKM